MSKNARASFIFLATLMMALTVGCTAKRQSLPFSEGLSGYNGGAGGGGVFRVAGNEPAKAARMSANLMAVDEDKSPQPGDRKIVRTGSLQLLVNDVDQSVNKIRGIAEHSGGFVEKSTVSNTGTRAASLTLRIPADRLDDVMRDIKASATRVDRETLEASDVTRQYIDLDARLRNVQAEEQQYLQIMKRATTLKDTLDVSEKLSDVRGRIEELQGEMKYLKAQIAMSSLEVSLQSEAEARVLGVEWKPLRQAKTALADMLSGLADWADSVIAFFINLPLILLWIVSIVFLVIVAWRIMRFFWRRYGPKQVWRLRWVPKSESGPSDPH